MPGVLTKVLRLLICSASLLAAFTASAQSDQLAETVAFEIPAQSLEGALLELSKQSSLQIVFSSGSLPDRRTSRVSGRMPIRHALDLLLRGTDLAYKLVGERTLTVIVNGVATPVGTPNATDLGTYQRDANGNPEIRAAQAGPDAQTSASSPAPEDKSRSSSRTDRDTARLRETSAGVPEVLVKGSKILNMDIRRSRDDTQPYIVLGRETIERSGAVNVEDFLKQRLPMNTVSRASESGGIISSSGINLRGLGTNQTLILIDGRRSASGWVNGILVQPDLNGIPLAAIERIEVLPTTASGIYGGGATGGVINVVLRRDYAGMEVHAAYQNSFDTDSSIRRIDASGGFSLEGGKTNVLLTAAYSDQNSLAFGDRDFIQGGRAAILANNPSSLFGSPVPVVGATTNIRSSNGSNLILKNGVALNSPVTFVPPGYAGPQTDAGAALVPNAGRYNFALASTAQSQGGATQGMVTGPEVISLTATVRRQWTPGLQVFLEAAASNNTAHWPFNAASGFFSVPASAPGNPFQQAINVRVPVPSADGDFLSRNDSRRVAGGLILRLPGNWSAAADYTFTQTRWSYSGAPTLATNTSALIGTGTINILRDSVDLSSQVVRGQFTIEPFRAKLRDATLRLSGPLPVLPALPAGKPVISTFLEHRDEEFPEAAIDFAGTIGAFTIPSRSQSVKSAYVEARVPLISERQDIAGARELELQLAGRWDGYTVHGSAGSILFGSNTPIVRATNKTNSLNPTAGLRYQATPGVMLRTSYGTGFLPPTVIQLISFAPQTFSGGSTDPRRGNEQLGVYQRTTGGNPGLQPEESESWSAGLVLTPTPLPGFRLSVDYTRIDKSDIIATIPGSDQGLLNNEGLFPGRVTREAPASGDPFGVGRVTAIDLTSINVARAKVEAYDAQVDYRREAGAAGAFEFFAVATWQTHYKTQLLSNQPVVENVGISTDNPLKFKGNGGLTWTYGDWTLGWVARHFSSYVVSANPINVANQGSPRVPSQTYHDLLAGYRWKAGSLAGTELQIGIKNVFNKEPPFDANNVLGYFSYFGDPRLASYHVSIRHSF